MRRKPLILENRTDPRTHVATEALAASGHYAVLYDGKPINLRRVKTLLDEYNKKYERTAFPSTAPARNLAAKLNALFKTNKFAAYEMVPAKPI